jgi:predicted dehydrogenase
MLRVAIVGCGKIADAHASQIAQIDGCEIVGVCDREPLMAKQLYERFPIKYHCADLNELISETHPDVVHITTPPESHFALAKSCLENGSHVYVEKPFTVNAPQAKELLDLATTYNLKITVGHNYQFSHASQRMRTLIESGYLGGAPIHMESTYGYSLANASYGRALLGDHKHWVRRLPGKLLHNIISHGIARIAEFLTTESPRVISHAFVSPLLKELGEREIVDELRVIISDDEKTTAYFTFSSQMRPVQHEFRVYGVTNGIVLDQTRETVIKLRGSKLKSYADHFVSPVLSSQQSLSQVLKNLRLFLNRDFHMNHGMKHLIELFYSAIRNDTAVPIPYSQILLTARIMDDIFDQIATGDTNQYCVPQADAVGSL